MIFSQWKADGGYDYYATADRRALGADLPTPRFAQTSPIGVPSTQIGRPMPASAQRIGSGPLARGQVTRMTLSGVLGAASVGAADVGWLFVAVIFGWWLRGAVSREVA